MANERLADRAAKLATVILSAGGMFCVLVLFYVFYQYGWTQKKNFTDPVGMLVYYGVPAALAAFFFLAHWLPPRAKVNLSLCIFSGAISLYVLETGLNIWNRLPSVISHQDQRQRVNAAKKLGLSYDTRTILEVVDDLRRKGIDAYPYITSSSLLQEGENGSLRSKISIAGEEVLSLSGVSNKLTVLCNESGAFVSSKSDAHGFRNPEGIWNRRPPEVVALGDSYTHGHCVPDGETFVDRIRMARPATVSVGIAGHGPLLMLASLKEYAKPLRAKRVLWFYYEGNDLANLSLEKRSPVLRRYLGGSFTQDLFNRQADIDRALTAHVQTLMTESRASRMLRHILQVGNPDELLARKEEIFKLSELRNVLGLVYGKRGVNPGEDEHIAYETELDLFRQVLSHAQETVHGWGGEIYFIYLPHALRYINPDAAQSSRDSVLDLARSLGLQVIDIHDVFRSQDDPMALFPFGMRGHYNEAGNKLVAETVLRALSQREIADKSRYRAGYKVPAKRSA